MRKTKTVREVSEIMGFPILRIRSKLKYLQLKAKRGYSKKKKTKSSKLLNKTTEIINLHNEGKTPKEISVVVGLKYFQVYYKLQREGLKPHTNGTKKRTTSYNKRFTLTQKRKMIDEYYKCDTREDRLAFASKYNLDLNNFQKAIYHWKTQTEYNK